MKYPCSRLKSTHVTHIAKTYEEEVRSLEVRHFLQTINILK